MFISKKKFEFMQKKIKQLQDTSQLLDNIAVRQNKLIVQLNEEVKHYQKLIGLYEACLKHGTKIDFPDVTGPVKGGSDNTVNNNYFD